MEDPASGMAQRHSCKPVEAHRGNLDTEGGELNQTGAVQIHLVPQCGREDLLQCPSLMDDRLPPSSIPLKLIEVTLDHHHIPNKIMDLNLNYYGNFRLKPGTHHSLLDSTSVRTLIGCLVFSKWVSARELKRKWWKLVSKWRWQDWRLF